MKVVLTGVTGFIGREILDQCLQNPSITSIVALSRRELQPPLTSDSKVKVVVMDDFLVYPKPVLEEMSGAEACIWALGKARMPDNKTNRKVSVDYTLAAAQALEQNSSPYADSNQKFRFVYLSGAGAEKDQGKSLWVMQDYGHIRGEVENKLLSFAKDHDSRFQSYIMRPGMVLPKEMTIRSLVFGLGPSVKVDALAEVMIDVALRGNDCQVFENTNICAHGS
ncbi:hypothetical protein PISL3812_01152 [Talaromyces islandicus]|uniref:NAD(P)-binding domain-containing protein n=1 Tax=Talaromyces islandicus TaxID=28573 RepID=A0A0U1LN08_TALIS|nr:hypothetical protein PISL3812_01152 [Talaromyces islandicus]